MTVEWWYRWQALEDARAARQAWEHYQKAENPSEELSEDEQSMLGRTMDTQKDNG